MAARLPEDIFHMICDTLIADNQFGTLFALCTANRNIARAAIKSMYRYRTILTRTAHDTDGSLVLRSQHMATIQDDPSDEAIMLHEHELIVQRWSILWRSIILSAMDKTYFEYCTYIRLLDMRDFRNLLDDERFRGRVRENFFSGDLRQFEIQIVSADRRRRSRLDIVAIVDAVGELLTQKTPLVDTISGTISTASLMRWIPRLDRLRSLDRLWDGTVLNGDVAELLRIHCKDFNSCSFFTGNVSQDSQLASFFAKLNEQSLESFETFSTNGFGVQCCLALARHSDTLKRLQLHIQADVIPRLGLLKSLTALETLHLFDIKAVVDLEDEQKDVFLEVVQWLKACRKLHSLKLHQFISGAAIATPLLLQSHIRIRHLEATGYASKDQKKFHLALANQTDLEYLILESDPIETRDDLDGLVESLSELHHLRGLKLMNISWHLNERHLKMLCDNLQLLEEFYTGGLGFTDNALDFVSTLPKLTEMTFAGITNFTFQGLLDFCDQLASRNQRGVLLAVDNADPDTGLSDDEQSYMRAEFIQRCGGKLEYTLFRGLSPNEDPSTLDFFEDELRVFPDRSECERIRRRVRRVKFTTALSVHQRRYVAWSDIGKYPKSLI